LPCGGGIVNDGLPAHIGVAMGKKELKSLNQRRILVDDLSKMIVAVSAGRRIYTNLKKAIQYIVSIHIPIILTVALPLFFWMDIS
jgi:Ca2+-transporting ATPase